jgi:hypothetical protein
LLCLDGIADFNALHSGKLNAEVQLCAFDILAIDGEDLLELPLSMRKTNLERLLRGRPDGIFINPFETGAIGPDLFRAACDMGLEADAVAVVFDLVKPFRPGGHGFVEGGQAELEFGHGPRIGILSGN